MSGGNVSCNLMNQIGTASIDLKTFPDAPVNFKDCSVTSDEIAGSILNDILESALDIATKTSDTEVHKYEETLKKSLATKMEMSKSATKETEKVFFPDTVGDITNSCQLCINPSDGIRITEEKVDDLVSQHPPPENLSKDYRLFSSSKSGDKIEGLGDHGEFQEQGEKYGTKEVCPIPRMVEKKSRLTDLVKNSPQVISEYLKADEETKRKQDEWERVQESVLRVIELECIKPGEEPKVASPKTYEPEKIALPEDDNENDLLNVPPKEENMEDVDLNRASTSSGIKTEEIVGDVCTIMSCPRKKKEVCSKPESTASLQKEKRKKASFLTRFLNLFKRGKSTSQKDVREDH